MEVEVELQEKIAAAAMRLAQDRSHGRSIRKKRIQSFHKASNKVTNWHYCLHLAVFSSDRFARKE